MAHVVLVLVVYVLACARITRLINGDTILDPARLALAARGSAATHLPYTKQRARWDTAYTFVTCPWCISMWVCLLSAWVPLYFADNPVAWYVMVALAASHLIGVFAFAADTEEIEVQQG